MEGGLEGMMTAETMVRKATWREIAIGFAVWLGHLGWCALMVLSLLPATARLLSSFTLGRVVNPCFRPWESVGLAAFVVVFSALCFLVGYWRLKAATTSQSESILLARWSLGRLAWKIFKSRRLLSSVMKPMGHPEPNLPLMHEVAMRLRDDLGGWPTPERLLKELRRHPAWIDHDAEEEEEES